MSAATAGIVCALVYLLIYVTDNAFISWDCTTRPIVVAPLTGLLLGDPVTGIVMGASLEAIFMGISAIGGSIPSDALSGSIIAVAYVVLSGGDQQTMTTGLALATGIGAIMGPVNSLIRTLRGLLAPYWEKLAEQCRPARFFAMNVLVIILTTLPVAAVVGLGVGLGVDALQGALDACPAWVITGLSAGGSMMTAVGLGILLSLVWSGKLAVFFFVGFVLTQSLGLPSLGVAVIGVGIALFYFFVEKDALDMVRGRLDGAAVSKEEPAAMTPSNGDDDFFA